MQPPKPLLFDQTLSDPPAEATSTIVLMLVIWGGFMAFMFMLGLVGGIENGFKSGVIIAACGFIALPFIMIYLKVLPALKATHPVVLREKGFAIGRQGSDFVPLEYVTDIVHVGTIYRRLAPAYEGFEVKFRPAHPTLGSSFIFVVLGKTVKKKYTSQYLFRQAILQAARNRRAWLAQNPGQ